MNHTEKKDKESWWPELMDWSGCGETKSGQLLSFRQEMILAGVMLF